MKKALILDLDNTIYPVSSIAEHLFKQLFNAIDINAGDIDESTLENIKYELTRRPFHLVADEFNFEPQLRNSCIELLNNLTYDFPMQPFDGYEHVKDIPLKKFLVTTGFTKLQWSKINRLDIEHDFDEIHIVDFEIAMKTKKDVFADIMERHHYTQEDLLVIGDDLESEIKAATELGIDTFLFDPDNKHPNASVTFRKAFLKDVLEHL
jgi:putative hydrolase of the HAD superfamily